MGALPDPKLEAFAQSLALNLAAGVKRTAAATAAAKAAGYGGRSIGPNARKRAGRADIKARVAELQEPGVERAKEKIALTIEWATEKLVAMAGEDMGPRARRPADQLRAIELLAKLKGWMAPEKREHSGPDGDPITAMLNFVDGKTRGLPADA